MGVIGFGQQFPQPTHQSWLSLAFLENPLDDLLTDRLSAFPAIPFEHGFHFRTRQIGNCQTALHIERRPGLVFHTQYITHADQSDPMEQE